MRAPTDIPPETDADASDDPGAPARLIDDELLRDVRRYLFACATFGLLTGLAIGIVGLGTTESAVPIIGMFICAPPGLLLIVHGADNASLGVRTRTDSPLTRFVYPVLSTAGLVVVVATFVVAMWGVQAYIWAR